MVLSASNQANYIPKLSKIRVELQEIETQIADQINAVSSLNPTLLSYINEKVTELVFLRFVGVGTIAVNQM